MEKVFGIAVLGLVLVLIVTLCVCIPTYLLWNWLAPTLFGLPIITLWQALGLCILGRCLFGSSGSSSSK